MGISVRLDDVFSIVGPEAVREVGRRLADKIRANSTVEQVLAMAPRELPSESVAAA